jgi:anaerobic ribonucleoside-triphosphate reductase activating protein
MQPIAIQVAKIVHDSAIYGPGRRTVIWVQGCSLGCKGCWNNDIWPFKGGSFERVEDIIGSVGNDVEGITLLGGEPLQQPRAVLRLIELAKSSGLTVMLYTGFEPHELKGDAATALLLSDIAIVGRYVHEKRNTSLRWRGSSNQRILIMSEKYHDLELEERNEFEIHLDEDGSINVFGYPDKDILESILNDI